MFRLETNLQHGMIVISSCGDIGEVEDIKYQSGYGVSAFVNWKGSKGSRWMGEGQVRVINDSFIEKQKEAFFNFLYEPEQKVKETRNGKIGHVMLLNVTPTNKRSYFVEFGNKDLEGWFFESDLCACE